NSFQNLVAVADEANHQGTLLFRWLDPRSENELVQERYERQLGVSLSIAGRLLGPQLVKSAAITGSDPFFLAGTDVALLFESANAKALTAAMKAQIGLAADAQRVHAECARLDGVSYTFWRSPDRRMSAYLAELGGHVVLTNSPAQLARLSAVAQGKAACLAELSEYAFFRDRYPRGDAEETALLFISDPALRRWCGPRWRIADSRRIRAAARMSSILAEKLDSLGAQSTLDTAAALPAELAPFGSLAFLTPIAELDLRRVTRSEAEAYGRWRDGYQRNWNWKFDPIGVRLTVRPVKLGVDLTVMPLIANSQYDTYLDVARGAAIAPHAGDRHETLLHVALAVNRNSSNWRRLADIFTSTNKQAQGWLGQSIEFYLDDDPIWRELAEVPGDERLKFLDTHWQRVPIAFRLEADDADRLQQFMPALKSFLASSFLNLSVWETFTYREQECVRVGPTPEAAKQQPYLTHFGLFLAATPEALIVTPSKELLKRAIDRRLDHPPAERADPTSTARRPWLGSSMALQLTPREWALLLSAVNSDYRWTMQFRSWSNLPILNEWKRRYGDQDPVELHERHWHTRLVCPGGGQYVWNDEWQTMESTVYGHPAAPRAGPAEPPNFQGLRQADFGITFEEHGLRARVEIVREP
ncbi:MAG TPA: hypothetical protein VGX76_21730, partial [Pirellulales bacterium]|nr:hypothetical protein [Pirellulales bacterium]